MPDTEQWVRLINIIQYLARRESSTIRDINDSLFNGQIPVRTLQRDLEKLVLEESIPVEIKEEHQGHEKVFYIEDIYKDKFSKSAMSQEEAIAGKLVIQSLGAFKGTPIEETLKTFEDKFTKLIPNRIFEAVDTKLGHVTGGFETFQMGTYDYSSQGQLIMDLIRSIVDRKKCMFHHQRLNKPEAVQYNVFPLKLVQYRGALYVYAQMGDGDDIFSFAVHRLLKVDVLDETFEITEKVRKGLEKKGKQTIGIFEYDNMQPEKVALLFHKTIAYQIVGRQWHETQKIVNNKDGSLILTMNVPITEELISWILWWQDYVKVEKPRELAETIRERAKKIAGVYV